MRHTRTAITAALGAAVLLAGCGSSPTAATTPAAEITSATPKAATTVAAWYQGGGKDFLATLTADITSVITDDRQHDTSSVGTDCVQLTGDMTPAQNYAKIPDPQAQRSWSAALAALHQGYWDCNGGMSDNDAATLRKGVLEIESAAPDLAATTKRITAVTR